MHDWVGNRCPLPRGKRKELAIGARNLTPITN